MRLQTNAARAGEAAVRTLLGLPLESLDETDARLAAVDKKAVAAFARGWLDASRRQRLVVRPR
jgi:predicted Zn-dependent peptidase